jgi:zinc transporter ZupT
MAIEALAPSLVAGAGFGGVAAAGLAGFRIRAAVRDAAIGVAAGILLAVAFAELFPEGLELAGIETAPLCFLAGFAGLFLVEVATRGHTHHQGGEHGPVEEHAASLIPFLTGLALHNVVDGAVLATSTELSAEAGVAVSLGILVHQLPVGISLAAVLGAAGVGRRRGLGMGLALAAAIPVGALAAVVLPSLDDAELGGMLAAAAGALGYIASGHLLPEAQREHPSASVSALFPAALLGTALLFAFAIPE